METSIPTATVQSMMSKGDHAEALNCDSVRISRVRLLLSRIKLQTEGDDSGTGGRDVKAGPAVITFERGNIVSVFATTVPVGRYNRIKLEYPIDSHHRKSSDGPAIQSSVSSLRQSVTP